MWCSGLYGSIKPSSASPGAMPVASALPGRRGAKTMGRRIEVSAAAATPSSSQSSCAAASEATITANGLSSRALRFRSSATADSSVASATRWYPPMPLIAAIRPEVIAATATSRAD
jgi:hypothetical protein